LLPGKASVIRTDEIPPEEWRQLFGTDGHRFGCLLRWQERCAPQSCPLQSNGYDGNGNSDSNGHGNSRQPTATADGHCDGDRYCSCM